MVHSLGVLGELCVSMTNADFSRSKHGFLKKFVEFGCVSIGNRLYIGWSQILIFPLLFVGIECTLWPS